RAHSRCGVIRRREITGTCTRIYRQVLQTSWVQTEYVVDHCIQVTVGKIGLSCGTASQLCGSALENAESINTADIAECAGSTGDAAIEVQAGQHLVQQNGIAANVARIDSLVGIRFVGR